MDRRTYLRGVAATATASVAGLAGCLGDDSESKTALDWMPTPDVFGQDGYRAFVTPPAEVGDISDSLDSQTMTDYRSRILDWQVASPDPSDVSLYVSGTANIPREEDDAGFIAVEHDLDGEMLSSNLLDSGFEEAGTHQEYDIYETSNGLSARGLADGTLVAGAGPVGATPIVEGVIDTYEGESTRYEADNDAIADVVDAIETDGNFWVEGYPRITNTVAGQGVFKGSTGRGYSITLDTDTIEAIRVESFAEDSDVREEDIDTYTDAATLFDNANDLDWEVDGNMLHIEWTMNPGDLSLEQMG
jgi:hypothetical protein